MLTGIVASIRWTYFNAAAINGFTITRDKDTRQWEISGHIVIADPFKLTQQPLYLRVPHKHGYWEWPIVSAVPRHCGPFVAALGAPRQTRTTNVHVDTQARIHTP